MQRNARKPRKTVILKSSSIPRAVANRNDWPAIGKGRFEIKTFDALLVGQATQAGLVMYGATMIPQGTDANQRDGDRITPVQLQVRGEVQMPNTATTQSSCRLVIVSSRTPLPVGGEIPVIFSPGFPSAGQNIISDPYNLTAVGQNANESLVEILYDQGFSFSPNGTRQRYVDFSIPLRDLMLKSMRWDSNAAVDPVQGRIVFIFKSDNSSLLYSDTCALTTRLLFTDC